MKNIGFIIGSLILLSATTMLFSCKHSQQYAVKEILTLNEGWAFQMKGDTQWLPATVPGCIHTDLMNNGKITDPFYRTNEKQLQWIDKKDWKYRCTFSLDSSKIRRNQAILYFKGLDTYAKVTLNGQPVLDANNMFREWKVEVKELLVSGENTLEIELISPVSIGLEKLHALGYGLPAANDLSELGELGDKKVSVFTRKAPYHYGWDWGPRFVTSGIWRPVELVLYDEVTFDNIFYKQSLIDESEANIDAVAEIQSAVRGNYKITITEASDKKPLAEASVELETGLNSITLPFKIRNPELWWPNGMGDQHMYRFNAVISRDDIVLDTLSQTIGLRSVELVREPDSSGKSFYFSINGKPLFAKGANYIPNDNFLDRVSNDRYDYIIKSAAEANMNMLRVWGGGIYENDYFYELCDKYGLLLWHDFMFSCSMYPGDDEFIDNVTQEIIDNVKRLRNHASIALWCGNNEIDAAWCQGDMNCGWGWKQQYSPEQQEAIWHSYDTLFHSIFPDLVEAYDETRAYWPSSPTADWGVHSTYTSTMGDKHYWGVWHGNEPFSAFYTTIGRFMSEYGFQSFPDFSTVKKFTLPEDWNIESEVMRHHQRSGYGNSRIIDYMKKLYPVPDNFEDILYVSQVMQAEAIKAAILAHRANKPYCMGSLYWQLNDCWPVASWSSIDYYGRWKALQYFAKKAFAPVAISFFPDQGNIRVYLNSDLPEAKNIDVVYKIVEFDGTVRSQKEINALLNSDRSVQILVLTADEIKKDGPPDNSFLEIILMEEGKLLASDHFFFVDPKDLKLTDVNLSTQIQQKKGIVEVTLSADKLAKNIYLSVSGCDSQFSDNYFDLLPGKKITVTMDPCGDKIITDKDLKIITLNSIINH